MASVAMTSLAFMLVLVPEPVWKMSSGNWASCAPLRISLHGRVIGAAIARLHQAQGQGSRGGAPFDRHSALMKQGRQPQTR